MTRPAGTLDALRAFHAEVDAAAAALASRHAARLTCRRGCSACCLDELTVFEVEAARILREAPEVLAGAPHPPGACACLDAQGGCRIYAQRPYVCRTQGLPLVAFRELASPGEAADAGRPAAPSTGAAAPDDDFEVVEQRDICPLNAAGEPLDTLDLDELWVLGPHELRLARIQQEFSGGPLTRVPLRSLFATGD